MKEIFKTEILSAKGQLRLKIALLGKISSFADSEMEPWDFYDVCLTGNHRSYVCFQIYFLLVGMISTLLQNK